MTAENLQLSILNTIEIEKQKSKNTTHTIWNLTKITQEKNKDTKKLSALLLYFADFSNSKHNWHFKTSMS